jgi:flagellin-like hook-associated protein FlgL
VPITLGNNIASLVAQRNLRKSSEALSASYERLSSGLRINRASDDAAGLALAAALDSQSRINLQGLRNINDGISYLGIADAALQELKNIVVRQQELAQQAANGVYTAAQRQAMQTEVDALSEEYDRIATSTSFNGRLIFAESSGALHLQAGIGTANTISVDLSNLGIQAEEISYTGDGTFQSVVSVVNTGAGTQVAVGDINNDGRDDVLTAYGGSARVLLSNGDGTFSAISLTPGTLGGDPRKLFVGDFNGDGNADIANTNYVSGIYLRLGNGNGTFKAHSVIAASANLNFGMSGADINQDGKLDLVYSGVSAGLGVVGVRLGNNDGSFKAAVETAVTAFTSVADVEIGDFNGDSILDAVAVGIAGGTDRAAILLGVGDGSFGTITTFAGYRGRAALGDFNEDGKLDVVTSGLAIGVRVALGNGLGGVSSTQHFSTSHGNNYGLVAGDFNADGNVDIVTSADNGTTGFLNTFLGNGDGTFRARATSTAIPEVTRIALGDFNLDGVNDLALALWDTQESAIALANSTATSGRPELDVTSVEAAQATLSTLGTIEAALTNAQGVVGAYLSRLEVTSSMLQATAADYRAAHSRILDIDVAQEVADMLRLQILQQSASAILAQANLAPGRVLALLLPLQNA